MSGTALAIVLVGAGVAAYLLLTPPAPSHAGINVGKYTGSLSGLGTLGSDLGKKLGSWL